jgi:hypothetical protein
MALELSRFLFAALIMILPGIFLAGWLGIGRTLLDRISHGASLGLAAACYLASLVSHFDLRWFFPLWGGFFLVVLIGWLSTRKKRKDLDHSHRFIEIWMALILILVAAARFGATLPLNFPRGWDPTFHMILAEKIRLTHHAIYDWLPFENIALNYPTGSHVLIVVMSWLCGLPLPTIFKNLIPLAGVLTTAQIYTLSRQFTSDAAAALFAAIAYAFWAIDGSLGYALWGGLPNELAMLFFIAMLSIWMESSPARPRIIAMGLLYAGVVLVHHHVMITSALVLGVCLVWSMIRGPGGAWRVLFVSLILAAVLDSFFLIPYATHAANIASTHIFLDGERPMNLSIIPGDRLGYVFTFASMAGLIFWIVRRDWKFNPIMICSLAVLQALFVLCEYVIPAVAQQKSYSTVFTASRFLADAVYFLSAAAGVAAARLRKTLRLSIPVMTMLLLLLGATLLPTWKDLVSSPDVPDDFANACGWIKSNTPTNTIVWNDQFMVLGNVESWTSYLAWRQTPVTPIPISEPIKDRFARAIHLTEVFEGKSPGDSNLYVVQIVPPGNYDGAAVLWTGSSGFEVIRIWPK